MFCDVCGTWTPLDEGEPVCALCGEPYQCGDCGYDVDSHGHCLRPEGCA